MAAFEIVNSNGVEVQCQVLCSSHIEWFYIFEASGYIFLASMHIAFIRSHVGWRGEQSILYKGVETSP